MYKEGALKGKIFHLQHDEAYLMPLFRNLGDNRILYCIYLFGSMTCYYNVYK